MCDFENEDQGNGVHHSQLSHSMANINLYESHSRSFFAISHVFEIFAFQNSWPWKCRSRSWCSTFAVATFDGKYLTANPTAIVIFDLSLTICEIFAYQIKRQHFDLENEGQGQGETRDLCRWTGNIRFHIGEFCKHFSYLATYVYTKGNTHARRQTVVMTIGKIS